MKVNVHEAKTNLSSLLQKAEAGEEVIIARNGKPVVKLVPCEAELPPRPPPGAWAGKVWMAPDFDELPPELLAAFNGEDEP